MTFDVAVGSTVINDFVGDNSDRAQIRFPFSQRERDWECVAPSFTLPVSSQVGITINEEDLVRIWVDGTLRFAGFVKEKVYDYASKTYELDVSSNLERLQRKKINYPTLHTSISNTSDRWRYNPSDNQGYPNVQVQWLVSNMFNLCGLTIDMTEIQTRYYTKLLSYNIYQNDLCLDENMLYGLNQPYCCNHTVIDANLSTAKTDYQANQITFFDLFKLFCSVFGWAVVQSTQSPTDYILKPKLNIVPEIPAIHRNFIVDDNLKFKYVNRRIKQIWEGWYINASFGTSEGNVSIRQSYAEGVERTLQAYKKVGTGTRAIDYLNGLYLMAHLPNSQLGEVLNTFVDPEKICENKIYALGNYNLEEIDTLVVFDKAGVLENWVNITEHTSEIKQENLA